MLGLGLALALGLAITSRTVTRTPTLTLILALTLTLALALTLTRTYGAAVEATIKRYLDMRYRLLPSLIAAGQQATADGTPLVARCDLLWPAHPEAASNLQVSTNPNPSPNPKP